MKNRDLGNISEVFLNNGDQVNLLWFFFNVRIREQQACILFYQVGYKYTPLWKLFCAEIW